MNKNKFTKKDIMSLVIIILVLAVFGMAFAWTYQLKKAHSSFENYSAFRGCVKVTERTLTSGSCITSSGENIKIIKAENGKWYLNGDFAFP